MSKIIYVCIFSIIFSSIAISDENQKKFDWKINSIPIVGQIVNKKYVKAGLLIAADSYAIYKFLDYYNSNQIGKRNTYAWWILGLYFYGIIDAYIDYQLNTFPTKKEEK